MPAIPLTIYLAAASRNSATVTGMFGTLLAVFGSACEETANSIGKYEIQKRTASIYTFGFLALLFGTTFLLVEGFVRHNLFFSLASLPTFLPRVALEILQAYVTVRAITISDRGDFGLVKTLTIPLLLLIDIALSYTVAPLQIVGMALIVSPIAFLLYVERRQIKGLRYLLIGAVNAAVTISLYKYDISHFNSVEAEQSLIGIALMVYFFIFAYIKAGENPLRFLRKRAFAAQATASGLANVAVSFAYFFAPASIILATLRSSAVLLAILTGRLYFRERHFLIRITLFVFVLVGLILLIL